MTARLAGFCLLLILCLGAPVAAQNTVRIVSRVNGGPQTANPVVFIRSGDTVRLELEVMPGKGSAFKRIRWQEVKPVLRPYDNTRGAPEPVEYRIENKAVTGQIFLRRFRHPGIYYFTISAAGPGRDARIFTPAALRTIEPLHRAFLGRVIQVVCRSDDSYLGYLSELNGTPFIMGPVVTTSGFHQTDQRVGSDCAAFATYGRRRQGFPAWYGGPEGIFAYLKDLVPGPVAAPGDGFYRDAHGNPVKLGGDQLRPGDILHFGVQVSVFYRHSGPSNFLTINDLVLESWGTTPHVTTIRDCGFRQYPVRVMRWK